MSKTKDLGTTSIISLFFHYYIPALTSILSVTIHQIINGIIVGQQVGKEGVAAIGLNGPILTVFIAFGLTFMIGGGILVAKNRGAQQYDKIQQIFQAATTLVLILGGVSVLSAPIITEPIAQLLAGGESKLIVKNTADYMFWAFLWVPFFLLRMLWGNFISNDQAPHIARNASLLSVLANIILDVVLVIIFPLGVAGASIATGISIFIAVVYIFIYISKGKSHFSFKDFTFTLKLDEWKKLVSFGLPSCVSEISFALGLLLLNIYVTPYGVLAVSAFGVINYVSFILLRFFTAAMIAVLPIISFNIGAQLPLRVKATLKISLLFTFLLGIGVCAAGWIFPHLLISLFSNDKTQAFIELASHAIRLYFILFIAAGCNYVLSAYMQSIGKAKLSSIINVSKGLVLVVLFLFFLPDKLDMKLDGIWLSRSLSEVGTLLVIGAYTLYLQEKYYSNATIIAQQKEQK